MEIEQKIYQMFLLFQKLYIILAQRKYSFPVYGTDWGLWVYVHWPDFSYVGMQNIQHLSDLFANSLVMQKVKRVTQDFIILYLVLTNKDKLVMELKVSGTWEKADMSTSCL